MIPFHIDPRWFDDHWYGSGPDEAGPDAAGPDEAGPRSSPRIARIAVCLALVAALPAVSYLGFQAAAQDPALACQD